MLENLLLDTWLSSNVFIELPEIRGFPIRKWFFFFQLFGFSWILIRMIWGARNKNLPRIIYLVLKMNIKLYRSTMDSYLYSSVDFYLDGQHLALFAAFLFNIIKYL
jgi:hypothetical protein